MPPREMTAPGSPGGPAERATWAGMAASPELPGSRLQLPVPMVDGQSRRHPPPAQCRSRPGQGCLHGRLGALQPGGGERGAAVCPPPRPQLQRPGPCGASLTRPRTPTRPSLAPGSRSPGTGEAWQSPEQPRWRRRALLCLPCAQSWASIAAQPALCGQTQGLPLARSRPPSARAPAPGAQASSSRPRGSGPARALRSAGPAGRVSVSSQLPFLEQPRRSPVSPLSRVPRGDTPSPQTQRPQLLAPRRPPLAPVTSPASHRP